LKTNDRQLELALSSLKAAKSSLNLAIDLLSGFSFGSSGFSSPQQKQEPLRPLITGDFDGSKVKLSDGKIYDVAPNYIAKAPLVYGDVLKLDRTTKEGKAYFKQHKRVRRIREDGVIAKKDGKWVVVTSSGSHKLEPYAVVGFGAKEGDEATVLLPEGNKTAPFAAMEKVAGKEWKEEKREEKSEIKESKDKEVKKEEKKVGEENSQRAKREMQTVKKKVEKRVEKEEPKTSPKKEVADDDLR